MIFLDTSAIYALADRGDPRNEVAKERFQAVLQGGEGMLTHNYVLVESMALIQHRLGLTRHSSLIETPKPSKSSGWTKVFMMKPSAAWPGLESGR